VFNVSNVIKGNMYTEIHQQYSYIRLISDWEENTFHFREQLTALKVGKPSESWNPNARFVINFMANCTHFYCKNISDCILSHLLNYHINNAIFFS
jgi:hypothetical protein